MRWKYELDADETVCTHRIPVTTPARPVGWSFVNDWIRIDPIHSQVSEMVLTVFSEYAWDGCSPKLKVGGCVVGVPDGKYDEATGEFPAKRPSLFHDAMYQFCDDIAEAAGVDVRDVILWADNLFYDLMGEDWPSRQKLYTFFTYRVGYTYNRTGKKVRKVIGKIKKWLHLD